MPSFEYLKFSMADFLPKLAIAILIFVAGLYLSKLAAKLVAKIFEKRGVQGGATRLITEVTQWSIIIVGVIMALQQFMDVTAFLTGLGIIGFTVGFALQDVMKNFAAGVILLVQQPFRVGDSIAVQDFNGQVMGIDLRSTELVTLDGRIVTLPNADVLNHAIINFTRSKQRRIEIPVGVAYSSDMNQVREVGLNAISQMPGLLSEPEPQVIFQAFNASSIDVSFYFWIHTDQIGFLVAKDTSARLIKEAFDANGIEIPFPVQTLVFQRPQE